MTGYGFRKGRLVKTILMESDAECFYGPAALCLHQCDHERGINTARKKCAQRDICDHLLADGVEQQAAQPFRSVVFCAFEWLSDSRFRDSLQRPVRCWVRRFAGLDLGFGECEHTPRNQ